MVYRPISDELRARAVMMVTEGEWDIEDVAEVFGVSTRSITRWEAQFDEEGLYTRRKGLAGRPRQLSAPVVEEITKLLQENPSLYLDEIIDWLALTHEQPISIGALCDNLRELGLTRKRARNIAAQRDEALRREWIDYAIQNFTAEQLVFTDESGKDGHTMIRNYGRAPIGSTPEVEVNHDRGIRYSILPALTLDGYIALRVVKGSVDSEEFFDFIISDVIPHMNPFPGPRSVLVLDNATIHRSDAVREAIQDYGCILMYLPPYSPDLNPIEESFSCVKGYLRRHWTTFQESEHPEEELKEACRIAVTPEKATGWITTDDVGQL